MKRMLMALASSSTIALIAPAVAAAHHSHHRNHARSHKHASGARIVRFGAASVSANPTPSTPIVLPPSVEPPPGKVVSFEKEVLTITFKEGGTVSGKVTDETQLRCQPANPPAQSSEDDQDGGDDGNSSQSDEQGTSNDGNGSQNGEQGTSNDGQFTQQHGDAAHSADAQDDDDNGSQTSCDTSLLTKETGVLGAELKFGSAGPVWDQVTIIH